MYFHWFHAKCRVNHLDLGLVFFKNSPHFPKHQSLDKPVQLCDKKRKIWISYIYNLLYTTTYCDQKMNNFLMLHLQQTTLHYNYNYSLLSHSSDSTHRAFFDLIQHISNLCKRLRVSEDDNTRAVL